LLKPKSLVLTDYDGDEEGQSVLKNLEHNLALNGLLTTEPPVQDASGISDHLFERQEKSTVDIELLDWFGATEESLASIASNVDLVFAADVVYTPSIVTPLVRVIHGLIKAAYPKKLQVLIAGTLRYANTFKSFLEELLEGDVAIEEISKAVRVEPLFLYEGANDVLLYHVIDSRFEGP